MTNAQMSVGVVGAGTIAVNVHIPVLRAMQDVHIAWVADADLRRAQSVAKANKLTAVPAGLGAPPLPPCDAIILAIPLLPRRHYLETYTAGETAFLVEKPFALDASEHRRWLSLYAPWRLGCGYQRRHYATSRLLRQAVRSGCFGPLRSLRLHEGGRVTRAGEAGYSDDTTANGGGLIKNLGCHSLDLALWITGADRCEIAERHVEWDGETDRQGTARIRLKDVAGNAGHDCDFDWSVSWLEPRSNTIELRFDSVTLRCPTTPVDEVALVDIQGQLFAPMSAKPTGGATTITQAFFLEWTDFLAGVRNRKEALISATSALPVTILMDELLQR